MLSSLSSIPDSFVRGCGPPERFLSARPAIFITVRMRAGKDRYRVLRRVAMTQQAQTILDREEFARSTEPFRFARFGFPPVP